MLKLTNARSGLPLWINPIHVVAVSRETMLDLNGPVAGAPVWTEVRFSNGAPVRVTEDAEQLAAALAALIEVE